MPRNSNLVPVAILLSGVVLSGSIFALRHEDAPPVRSGDVSQVLPVGPQDHAVGDGEPSVTLITYTDIDCQFCKRFHEVMEQLMAEYGEEGRVQWVVRHFPILDLHPYSGTHAKAAECAAKLGGESMFWSFISALHREAPGGEQFNPEDYASLAGGLGLSAEALISCSRSSEFDERVARDFENGLVIGAKGTPFTVIMMEGAEPSTISGFVPYEGMKTVIERALSIAP